MIGEPEWADGSCRYSRRQFRYLFERVERPVPPRAEIVTAYTDGTVTFRRNRRIDGYHQAATLDGFKGVHSGDFVVHGLDILRGSVGISDATGAISAVCTTCQPRVGVEPRFFAYALRAQAWTGYTRAFARGVREGGADFRRWATLGDLRLPVPPYPAQRTIAEFLDAKTPQLNALIKKKRRMIDLIEMRWESQVRDRLSDVGPRVRLKRKWSVIDCKHRTPAYVDDGYPVTSPGNLAPGRIDLSRCDRFVDDVDFRDLTEGRRPKQGDIIYSRNASAGIAAYVDTDQPFCMGQDVCLITSLEQDQRFLMYA